jgi:hypothetical protein
MQDALGSGLNLRPPDDDGRKCDGGDEITGKLIIAGGDTPPVFQMRERPLDQISVSDTATTGLVLS